MSANNGIEVYRGQTLRLILDYFQGEEDGPTVNLTGATIGWMRYTLPTVVTPTFTDAAHGQFMLNFTEADTLAMAAGKVYPLQLKFTMPNGDIKPQDTFQIEAR